MRRFLLFSPVLLAVCCWAPAQQLTVAKPEAIAGRWEAADGHSGMVGMAIMLRTHVAGTPVSLIDQTQYLDTFEVGVYRRVGPEVAPFGFNFYVVDEKEGGSWDGQHLAIHADARSDLPKINIELTWHEKSHTWTGRFERGEFSGQVTLKRPESATVNALVGTWFTSGEQGSNCVHIAQQTDGALTAWSDDIQILGRVIYANGLQPPSQTLEGFGEIAKVKFFPPDRIAIELGALPWLCCSQPFAAKITANGKKLVGEWIAGPNQTPRRVQWSKMPDDSCLAAASEPPSSAATVWE